MTPEEIRSRLRKAAGVKESDTRLPATEQAQEITDSQRYILQNIFDTGSQAKRREAYLNKHGFELNPNDHNQYRPAGSSSDWQEIDPGFGVYQNMFSEGGLKKAAAEFVKDAGDLSFDALVSGPMSTAAAGQGAAVGGVGGPAGIILGAILGGASGNAAAEGLKTAMGDAFLDKNVSLDKEKLLYESALSGVMPVAIKGGAASVKNVFSKIKTNNLISGLKAVSTASKKLGVLDESIIDDAIKNPTKYSEEALSNATRRLQNSYKDFYGIKEGASYSADDVSKISKDSIFGKILNPLKEAQNQEIEKLAKNPNASFKIYTGALEQGPQKLLENGQRVEPGIIDILQKNINDISAIPISSRSREQRSALSYLQTKMNEVISDAKKGGNLKGETLKEILGEIREKSLALNFDASKKLLESVQDDIYIREIKGASVLKNIFGGGPEGFRQMLDNKAVAAGSKLPEINAKLSQGLELFNNTQKNLSPTNIASAFTGKENIRKLQVQDDLNNIGAYAREASSFVDDVLKKEGLQIKNTIPVKDFSGDFKTEALQSSVENLFKTGRAIGSGNPLIAAGEQGLKTGAKRAGQAFGITVGPLGVGGASKVGGVAGALGTVEGFSQGLKAGSPVITMRNISEKGGQLLNRLGQSGYDEAISNLDQSLMSRLGQLPRSAMDTAQVGIGAMAEAPQLRSLGDYLRSQAGQLSKQAAGQGELVNLDTLSAQKEEKESSGTLSDEDKLAKLRALRAKFKPTQPSQ